MNTINYYFNQLPEPLRFQAIANTDESRLDRFACNLLDAIYNAFIWDQSNEGHDHWSDLVKELEADQFADDHEEEQRFDADNLSQFED